MPVLAPEVTVADAAALCAHFAANPPAPGSPVAAFAASVAAFHRKVTVPVADQVVAAVDEVIGNARRAGRPGINTDLAHLLEAGRGDVGFDDVTNPQIAAHVAEALDDAGVVHHTTASSHAVSVTLLRAADMAALADAVCAAVLAMVGGGGQLPGVPQPNA